MPLTRSLLAAPAVAIVVSLVPSWAAAGPPERPRADGAAAKQAKRAKPRTIRKRDLWATVNVCDTARRPDTVGVRASIPGDGSRARMEVRVRLQYLVRAKSGAQTWPLLPGSDSGWLRAGRAVFARRQTGVTFRFPRPSDGTANTLRGVVNFRWVLRGRVVRRTTRLTTAGHRSTAGADPRGFSAAACVLR